MCRFIFIFLIPLSILGCKSTPKEIENQKAPPQAPPGFIAQIPQKLVLAGENSSGRFSPDGKSILFISRTRSHHSQAQIYEYHLSTNKERRLTFQYGDTAWPSYSFDGQSILYSSTTDELKEEPLFIQQTMQRFFADENAQKISSPPLWDWFSPNQPSEIYLNELKTNEIHRLTHSQGFDSEPRFHPKNQKIIWVSQRAQNADLYLMTPQGDLIRRISSAPAHDHFPDFSPNGNQILWSRFADKEPTSELMLSASDDHKAKAVPLPKGLHLHPHWHPKGEWILFSSNMSNSENFELYTAKIDGSCLTRLTYSLDNELMPVFDPQGEKILYTAGKENSFQLLIMNFEIPRTCPQL